MQDWRRRGQAFLFPEDNDTWVAGLRVGLGLEVVVYCLSLGHDWLYFLAGTGQGLISRRLAEAMVASQSPLVPTLGWLIWPAQQLGIPEEAVLSFAWWWLLLAGIFLLAGIGTRSAAVSAWFVHLCAAQSGTLFAYGVDQVLTIGLFYLMLAPLPDRLTLEARIWQVRLRHPELLGFFRRVLQLHLCLIYFSGGLAKLLGRDWWTGDSLWKALTRPPFNIFPAEEIARFSWLLLPLGLAVCVLEFGYAFVIWREALRRPWLVLVCGMHLGIALFMGLHLFALNMIVLNLAAFGPRMPRVLREPA